MSAEIAKPVLSSLRPGAPATPRALDAARRITARVARHGVSDAARARALPQRKRPDRARRPTRCARDDGAAARASGMSALLRARERVGR